MKNYKDINIYEAYIKLITPPKDKAEILLKYLTLAVVSVLIVFSVIMIVLNFKYSLEVETLEREAATKRIIVRKIEKELKIMNLYDKKNQFIEKAYKENSNLIHIFDTIEAIIPKDLKIEQLSLNSNILNMKVSSQRIDSVQQFVYNMQTKDVFSEISYKGPVFNDEKKVFNADISSNVNWKIIQNTTQQ